MINKVTLLGLEFRLGIGFLNMLIEGTGKDLITLGQEVQTNSPVIVPQMMYYSLAYAARRNNTEMTMTIDDIYDMIDENGGILGSFSVEFQNAFLASMNQDVPADTSKKKAISPKK